MEPQHFLLIIQNSPLNITGWRKSG